MTYLVLAGCFLAVAVIAGAALSIVARRRGPRPVAVVVTILALFVLTAVFDTVMIATGLFHYAPEHLLGVHIGLAPVEDFAYPLAGALLLPALWAALRLRRRAAGRDDDDGGRP
ncbi:lycopene cyclase domain-containing protein [Microbacterium sp. 179-I 3D2 NHS]|uniref:lycopene cyclase domain-containing protein n=1 Tax=Microbacterium sp. 179-I 3D2 NHS TaxID=3235178 RepID=UPI0039A3AF2D